MMKKISIFLGCACFLSLFILQPALAQWAGYSYPYNGYPYSGFMQPNYGYSWNQPYSYGWDQTSYGWNQPYGYQPSYGWNQPFYGWNQPYSYGWNNYNYNPSNFNPYSYSYQNVSQYNSYMPYGYTPNYNYPYIDFFHGYLWTDPYHGYQSSPSGWQPNGWVFNPSMGWSYKSYGTGVLY